MLVDLGSILSSSDLGVLVSLGPDDSTYHQERNQANCYAGVGLYSDGKQMYSDETLAWQEVQIYLLSGANSEVWVRATLNSGSLDAGSSATGSWLALTSNRIWYIVDTTSNDFPSGASVTLEVATDSGGSTIIATETYTLSANNLSSS